MTVRPLRADDDRLIDRLIHLYQFKPYRDYRVWSKAIQRAILRAEVDRVLSAPDHLAVVSGEGDAAVVAVGRALAWDSSFFGVPMGRLDLLLRGPVGDHGTVSAAVDALLQQARAMGLRHLTAKVDIADMQAVAVLENAGFRLMDSLVDLLHASAPPASHTSPRSRSRATDDGGGRGHRARHHPRRVSGIPRPLPSRSPSAGGAQRRVLPGVGASVLRGPHGRPCGGGRRRRRKHSRVGQHATRGAGVER